MITTWREFQEVINEYQHELKEHSHKNKCTLRPRKDCLKLDKILEVFTNQNWGVTFEDTENMYILHFGQGENFAEDKVGIAWLVDTHTTIFFERPFNNKPLKVLQKLLPNHTITYDKNDIMIDGKKLGPSLPTGFGKREGTKVIINNGDSLDISIVEKSEDNTGHIYCIRWDNLDGLNERFKDSAHHQERLNSKAGLTTLSEYLSITKEEFEKLLEE